MRIRYKSGKPLGDAAEAMLTKALQTRLGVTNLRLILEQEPPPKPAVRRGARK